jgi:hypothetical protein
MQYHLGITLLPHFKKDSENLRELFYTTFVVVSTMKKVVFNC